MRLKLYRVVPEDREQLFMTAKSSHHGVTIFVSRELDEGRDCPSFTIEPVDTHLLADQQLGLEDMLTYGPWGIAEFDSFSGWQQAVSA
ncbi:hypothetical protein [Altererythrobacter sp. Root672]|uniref:hypothetical protein n=1 Tax=Altererythrobacter sp. Root672 TaxID=1736584 RepID=UPI0006F9526E|nr:hypothetical protein [Altererythrobacter sp. Root672]KRA81224.1 hypothetical protein ASD76_11615 [Altererythrobacter sp. Root672]